jgi:uncharacterized protein (DUF736 family)
MEDQMQIGLVQYDPAKDTYTGSLTTLKLHAQVRLVPNRKQKDSQPDYRILARQNANSPAVEIGAAWKRQSTDGSTYVSVSFAAPEIGPNAIYANLGRAAGQDDDDVFAIIWNPRSDKRAAEAASGDGWDD